MPIYAQDPLKRGQIQGTPKWPYLGYLGPGPDTPNMVKIGSNPGPVPRPNIVILGIKWVKYRSNPGQTLDLGSQTLDPGSGTPKWPYLANMGPYRAPTGPISPMSLDQPAQVLARAGPGPGTQDPGSGTPNPGIWALPGPLQGPYPL